MFEKDCKKDAYVEGTLNSQSFYFQLTLYSAAHFIQISGKETNSPCLVSFFKRYLKIRESPLAMQAEIWYTNLAYWEPLEFGDVITRSGYSAWIYFYVEGLYWGERVESLTRTFE